MTLCDIALTVFELEPNEYHWVLMEAVQAEAEECLGYRPIDSSTEGLSDYSQALIQGASALRVRQGLAAFGQPGAPMRIGEDATASASEHPARDRDIPTAVPLDMDSCMFTTSRASL